MPSKRERERNVTMSKLEEILRSFIYRLSAPVDVDTCALDEATLLTDTNDPSYTGILNGDSVIIVRE